MKQPYTFDRSKELWQRALKVIPGGSQGTRTPEFEDCPIFFDHTKGSHMWDVDGNEFIDFLCSIGPVLLGYAYDPVDDLVREVVNKGFQSSMNNPVLVDAAETLVGMIPNAAGVRYMKTGTEATLLAVRLARHITGRMYIARHGYHGWADVFQGKWNLKGVDADASKKMIWFDGTYQDLDRVMTESPYKFAAAMICPADVKPFTRENYQGIIDVAHKHGALAIFDEIKSGFRISPGGAQEYLGVTPDITTFSKGMANGYPLSAIVGVKGVIDQLPEAGIAGTFSVEGLALAASYATLKTIRDKGVVPHLYKMGQRLIDGMSRIIETNGMGDKGMKSYGDPVASMPRLEWEEGSVKFGTQAPEDPACKFFFSELMKRGIYFSSWHVGFMMFSHTEADVDEALNVMDDCMKMTKAKFR